MKVIIKYKAEMGRGTRYRAGSLQDLPESEAQELIKSGKAVPYSGVGRAAERETRVATPVEPPKPPVNNKRLLQNAKAKREAESKLEVKTEVQEEIQTEVEAVKQEGSEDGAEKDNRSGRKSGK